MQFIEGGVTAAKGFLAGGIHCGIRKNKSKADLAMIFSKTPCAAAGVYTQNLVKGAPILVTRKKYCGRPRTGGHLQQRQRQHLQRRRRKESVAHVRKSRASARH